MYLIKRALVSFFFLFSILHAELYENNNSDKNFTVNVDLFYASLARSIDGFEDRVSSTVNDILQIKMALNIFPKTYDIKLEYSQNLTETVDSNLYNPKGYDETASSLLLSIIPWYDKRYGGLGLFHTYAQQNSHYVNKTASPMALVSYELDNSAMSGWELLSFANDLNSNQSFQSKEEVSYTGFKYLLPKFSYLPNGANIYYSTMDRSTVYFATYDGVNKLIALSGKGELYGFGLQRSFTELPNDQLSLDLIQLSKGGFTGFPAVELSEYTAGVTYKTKKWYIKAVTLMYIVESFSTSLNNKILSIPKQTDIFTSLHFGLRY